jgi:hypothetical protein
MFYHVVRKWDENDLVPLNDQDEFARRWPDAGELSQIHAYRVHMYFSLDEAKDHQDAFGGEILVIDESMIDWQTDDLEINCIHATARRVPADAIRRYETGLDEYLQAQVEA